MWKKLVIVESPAKAKTIKKYLWKDYEVKASVWHIEDLPTNKLWVDIENNFQPEYEIMKWKKKVVSELKKLVKKYDTVYLATDQDREWEAISWHLIRVLKLPQNTPRIWFHEITKTAIQNAIKKPWIVDMNLVNAQQGRRVLDRLVWYKVSPILWKKIKMWLSAWRVQSVAVKLLVERENDIKNYKPTEIWELLWELKNNLTIKLEKIKWKKIDFDNRKDIFLFLEKIWININKYQEIEKDFKITELQSKKVKNITFKQDIIFKLIEIKKTKSKRKASAPFMTSTLQQEASNKLWWWVKQVMQIAQKLYENWFITYMRTDDISLSNQAIKQAEKIIISSFWKEYSKPTQYKSKSKNAQEAHEAIRPTDLSKNSTILWLSWQEASLYNLIYNRTLASQMEDAKIENTTYIFSTNNEDHWSVKWEVIAFDWFLKIYWWWKDNILPEIKKWDTVKSKNIIANQKWTKWPSRFTESALVKQMENLGIWRPSTYAAVISTIIQRWYVEKTNEKKLKPTEIAFLVTGFLEKQFWEMIDYKFTAKMEENLDKIALGKIDWIKMIEKFWNKFKKNIKDADITKKELQFVDKKCPKCGWELIFKFWKFGKFIACSNYPDCKYKEQTDEEQSLEKDLQNKYEGKDCPAWWKIVIKRSKNWYFLASDKYPKIKWAMSPDVYDLNEKYWWEKCDKCKEWEMIVKKWKRWYFLACNKFPKCKNIKKLIIK